METGANPRASIIVMHGLGADGSDFAPFVDEIDLAAIGPVRWLFPNAPQIPVSINGGYVMPAWYDIAADRSREDEAGLRRSQASIDALLAREQARGVQAHRIVLGGFSQGCAMALLTGLRYPQRLAGILGMSGYLPLAGALAALGYAVEWHQYPMGHSVCAPEVQDVQRWLLRVLDPALDRK